MELEVVATAFDAPKENGVAAELLFMLPKVGVATVLLFVDEFKPPNARTGLAVGAVALTAATLFAELLPNENPPKTGTVAELVLMEVVAEVLEALVVFAAKLKPALLFAVDSVGLGAPKLKPLLLEVELVVLLMVVAAVVVWDDPPILKLLLLEVALAVVAIPKPRVGMLDVVAAVVDWEEVPKLNDAALLVVVATFEVVPKLKPLDLLSAMAAFVVVVPKLMAVLVEQLLVVAVFNTAAVLVVAGGLSFKPTKGLFCLLGVLKLLAVLVAKVELAAGVLKEKPVN